MLMCLDVGNTHILGGIFVEDALVARFRYATHLVGSADQFGIFLLNILQANNIKFSEINAVAQCSVVPSLDYTLRHAITAYLHTELFVLQPGVKTGLNIRYKNPNEVGADRIANAIGAISAFPKHQLIIIDMGTATTVCAINQKHEYLGGAILPGMRLAMESLKNNTAKLMEVDIKVPENHVGRTTREGIQSGLFYGQLGALRELINGFKHEMFADVPLMVIGTGGFAKLYQDHALFDVILPDLVLQGLLKAYEFQAR